MKVNFVIWGERRFESQLGNGRLAWKKKIEYQNSMFLTRAILK